jgi:hypothetical protein
MHPQLQGVDVGGEGKVACIHDGWHVPRIGVEAREVVYNAGIVAGALQYGVMLNFIATIRLPLAGEKGEVQLLGVGLAAEYVSEHGTFQSSGFLDSP